MFQLHDQCLPVFFFRCRETNPLLSPPFPPADLSIATHPARSGASPSTCLPFLTFSTWLSFFLRPILACHSCFISRTSACLYFSFPSKLQKENSPPLARIAPRGSIRECQRWTPECQLWTPSALRCLDQYLPVVFYLR